MAYTLPVILLTTDHGNQPATCPRCRHSFVLCYVTTDVAECQDCHATWHPTDGFFAEVESCDPKPLRRQRGASQPAP